MSNETGGPAFPSFKYDAEYERHFQAGGMTLRDYFAAQAREGDWADGGIRTHMHLERAREYYAAADAMLEARK